MIPTVSEELQPGEQLGRYTVIRRLAAGGMAEVYLASNGGPSGFAKLVVLKRVLPRLRDQTSFTEMFLDEGRIAARLSHPNIAQVFELGTHEGSPYLVMEHVPGESVLRLVRAAGAEGRHLPLAMTLRVALQLLEALDYAHQLTGDDGKPLGVVHRDVSPTNVLVTYHGAVKLLDFGIARSATQEHHTRAGTVKGKIGYMAPEQALGEGVDGRTDIYAVGALLYFLTTGVGPFSGLGDRVRTIRAGVEGRFPKPSAHNPDLNPQLEAIILKAMSVEAIDRYPSAGRMFEHLEDCAVNQHLLTSTRSLGFLVRQLFPARAELARAGASPEVIAKLSASAEEIGSDEILSEPTHVVHPAQAPASAPGKQTVSLRTGGPTDSAVRSRVRTEPVGLESHHRELAEQEPAAQIPSSQLETARVPSMQALARVGGIFAVPGAGRPTQVDASQHPSVRPTQDEPELLEADVKTASREVAAVPRQAAPGTKEEGLAAMLTWAANHAWVLFGVGLVAVVSGLGLRWLLSRG